jgi:hypothetical protein
MNWKTFVKKQFNPRYNTGIFLKGLRESTTTV